MLTKRERQEAARADRLMKPTGESAPLREDGETFRADEMRKMANALDKEAGYQAVEWGDDDEQPMEGYSRAAKMLRYAASLAEGKAAPTATTLMPVEMCGHQHDEGCEKCSPQPDPPAPVTPEAKERKRNNGHLANCAGFFSYDGVTFGMDLTACDCIPKATPEPQTPDTQALRERIESLPRYRPLRDPARGYHMWLAPDGEWIKLRDILASLPAQEGEK